MEFSTHFQQVFNNFNSRFFPVSSRKSEFSTLSTIELSTHCWKLVNSSLTKCEQTMKFRLILEFSTSFQQVFNISPILLTICFCLFQAVFGKRLQTFNTFNSLLPFLGVENLWIICERFSQSDRSGKSRWNPGVEIVKAKVFNNLSTGFQQLHQIFSVKIELRVKKIWINYEISSRFWVFNTLSTGFQHFPNFFNNSFSAI